MTAAMKHPPTRPMDPTLLRALPQVQKLMESEAARELMARFPRTAVVDAIRDALEVLRRGTGGFYLYRCYALSNRRCAREYWGVAKR